MVKLIVGLGNPGQQYEKTRHNAGFLFLDRLIRKYGSVWVRESRFDGFVAQLEVGSSKVILLKPSTFMNRSGHAVGKIVRYYKILPEEVLVIHDDLDFEVGLIKLKKGGGHAGHNGLRDIIAHLGSKEFYRLRVGVGRPKLSELVVDYVLSNPSKKELSLILSVFDIAFGCMEQMVAGDMPSVMNKLNAYKFNN